MGGLPSVKVVNALSLAWGCKQVYQGFWSHLRFQDEILLFLIVGVSLRITFEELIIIKTPSVPFKVIFFRSEIKLNHAQINLPYGINPVSPHASPP